jgi:hypothetical protein
LSQGKDAAMGMAKGTQPLPFGHSAEAAVSIEGLEVKSLFFPTLRAMLIIIFSVTGESSSKTRRGGPRW